jgi:hypothetical protein
MARGNEIVSSDGGCWGVLKYICAIATMHEIWINSVGGKDVINNAFFLFFYVGRREPKHEHSVQSVHSMLVDPPTLAGLQRSSGM